MTRIQTRRSISLSLTRYQQLKELVQLLGAGHNCSSVVDLLVADACAKRGIADPDRATAVAALKRRLDESRKDHTPLPDGSGVFTF